MKKKKTMMTIEKILTRARQHYNNGDPAAAETAYKQILEKDPSSSEAHYGLGCIFKELGNIEASLDAFKTALIHDPDHKEAQFALGSALLKKGDSKEALLNLCPVANDFPADARLFHEIGQAWHSLNSFEKAKGAYQRALEIDSRYAAAYYDLACAELAPQEFVVAMDIFRKFLELDNNNKFALTNLAKAHFSMGEIDEAIRLFEKAGTEFGLINLATIIPGSPRANHQDVLDVRRSLNKIDKPQKSVLNNSEPIKIGYISSFFHRPNWMKPVWSLLNNHERSRFKIYIFSDAPENEVVNPDEGYHHFETDKFFNIKSLSVGK